MIENTLTILTASFFFIAVFVPVIIGVWRLIKYRSIEISDTSLVLAFLFLFLGNLSACLLLAVKDPQNIWGALLTFMGLTILLLLYGLITSYQIKRFRGKLTSKKVLYTNVPKKRM